MQAGTAGGESGDKKKEEMMREEVVRTTFDTNATNEGESHEMDEVRKKESTHEKKTQREEEVMSHG